MEEEPGVARELKPHAFHLNLPDHHKDVDGIPYITKFAEKKSREIIRLAHSIQLKESLFYREESEETKLGDEEDGEKDTEEDEDEDVGEGDHAIRRDCTLASVSKKCSRLQSQLSSLEGLKHSGITELELCKLVLHLLKLITATVTIGNGADAKDGKRVTIHYETVGYIHGNGEEKAWQDAKDQAELEKILSRPFALPTPARDSLMSTLISILSKKSTLRSVSNAAIFPNGDSSQRILLILHWKAFMRVLLRTAPYLDEYKWGDTAKDSNSRQGSVLKRTVQVIRQCRRFFDQGIQPNGKLDSAAQEVWDMVRQDVLHHHHTHACYRGLIILYLFQPTRCTSSFYMDVMPLWVDSWTKLDRCPEIDFLWMVLFCRARKHLSPEDYDWSFLRKRLLTLSQYWLQIPIGGGSIDQSFPRAANPRNRSCPSRLKALLGGGSSYEEGIDFVAKVAKLFVSNIGVGKSPSNDGFSDGTKDVLRVFTFLTPYFNPSNVGRWTFTLGAFLHNFSFELCRRIGTQASLSALEETSPEMVNALLAVEPSLKASPIPPKELVALLNVLLELCQQSLYSKHSHVGRAGEAALVYLAQIDPVHIIPKFLDFAASALDVSAVNLSHQAPAALSAITRLLQPALRRNSSVLLSRLPLLLNLSLAGIDSNDQNKTLRTLIFYRNLASWVPVGSVSAVTRSSKNATAPLTGIRKLGPSMVKHLTKVTDNDEYRTTIAGLSESSLIAKDAMDEDYAEQIPTVMTDWVLGFLDRVYDLFRAAGEREKSGKASSGVASRHSSSDVQQARNVSRILKETLMQVFAAMDAETFKQAVRSVTRFLAEESLPSASKDASALCQAVGAVRMDSTGQLGSPGLDALVPILTEDLGTTSNKTKIYRLRCLAGAVRNGGKAVYSLGDHVIKAIKIGLSSDDKHVYKTACKLLRHTLSSQSECYPDITAYAPRDMTGKGSCLEGDGVKWHVPDGQQIDFVCDLIFTEVLSPLFQLSGAATDKDTGPVSVDNQMLRQRLRALRYSLRGCSGLLLERQPDQGGPGKKGGWDTSLLPHEKSVHSIITSASSDSLEKLGKMRKQICGFVATMMSVIGSETIDSERAVDNETKQEADTSAGVMSRDIKICKELSELSLLLLTRRGASFRCQEGKTLWKAQKQLVCDYALSSEVNHLVTVLERCGRSESSENVLYKDGEDGGKTIPRRLLVTRVLLFYESLQRSASFEIPRLLRRQQIDSGKVETKLYSSETTLDQAIVLINGFLKAPAFSGLDGYEGLVDGLFSLSCHTNTQVRASAIGVVDYALTRFGWFVNSRVPRLLSAVTLKDEESKGKYGLPSCALLSTQVDSQGKRRRLGEVLKGVCSILALSRTTKGLLSSEDSRLKFIRCLCESDQVISLLPTEEMQKMVHYFQNVFSPFRSKFFFVPRATKREQSTHEKTLLYLMETLSDQTGKEKDSSAAPVHWRRRLLVMWFLLTIVDSDDFMANEKLWEETWSICLHLLESEMGQPMQRLAVGLFGRLLSYREILPPHYFDPLKQKLETDEFCEVLSKALAFDHREDTSIGGGHDAQWSAGVEEMIRDAARNVAPRTLFPFTRTGQSSGVFKVSHAQFVESLVVLMDDAKSGAVSKKLLAQAAILAEAPPSEDQRNQLVTAAEILAGVCRGMMRSGFTSEFWTGIANPFLRDVLMKTPLSSVGAYFDALRYGIQLANPTMYEELFAFVVANIESTMWHPNGDDEVEKSVGVDGFTQQSKWLYLTSSILIELGTIHSETPWHTSSPILLTEGRMDNSSQGSKVLQLVNKKLLPMLLKSVGHPYESCRDHIAGCLFRVHSSQRSLVTSGLQNISDPTPEIVGTLANISDQPDLHSKEYYNSLITMRKFLAYCVHLGNSVDEFRSCILPLLPGTFRSLRAASDESADGEEVDTAIRALQTEVFKGSRYSIAEVSVACVVGYISNGPEDIQAVLGVMNEVKSDTAWHVRQALAHFLRCFQGSHKFLFTESQDDATRKLVAGLLADERSEVSAAAMSTLTGILAATEAGVVTKLVVDYAKVAGRSKIKKKKKRSANGATPMETMVELSEEERKSHEEKEQRRARNQQTSVFFLCASVLAHPYDTPAFVPVALAAVSKHSFEKSAPLGVRQIVKKCCGEFKKTHMSDNWEVHRKVFNQEQLEALEDVVSTPHYYA